MTKASEPRRRSKHGRDLDKRKAASKAWRKTTKGKAAAARYRQTAPRREKRKARTLRLKAMLHEIKSQPCADCGGTFDPVCMDFDHRDSSEKVAKVSDLLFRSIEALKAEIAKCDVVCSNCHRLRTYRKRNHSALVRAALGLKTQPTMQLDLPALGTIDGEREKQLRMELDA